MGTACIAVVLVTVFGFALGARPDGNGLGTFSLFIAGIGMATIGTGWGSVLPTASATCAPAAIMQLTLFLGLFLTDAQTPIPLMDGWLEYVARWNPLTQVLDVARIGFIDGINGRDLLVGMLVMVAISAGAWLFAFTGLARLDD